MKDTIVSKHCGYGYDFIFIY